MFTKARSAESMATPTFRLLNDARYFLKEGEESVIRNTRAKLEASPPRKKTKKITTRRKTVETKTRRKARSAKTFKTTPTYGSSSDNESSMRVVPMFGSSSCEESEGEILIRLMKELATSDEEEFSRTAQESSDGGSIIFVGPRERSSSDS